MFEQTNIETTDINISHYERVLILGNTGRRENKSKQKQGNAEERAKSGPFVKQFYTEQSSNSIYLLMVN